MDQKNVQAQIQLLDSYVKDFKIQTLKKIDQKENLNVMGQLGFRIISIKEEEKTYLGQIELINDIRILYQGEEITNIHISMIGLFEGLKSEQFDRKSFEEMLKINGATTLSHLIRAYVYSVTGLSGIPQITTPMVNFVKFFENAKEIKNK